VTVNLKSSIKPFFFLAVLSLAAMLSSCDPHRKAAAGQDLEKKLEAARAYYADGNFAKSQPLLEELISIYRGTPKGETIYFNYAMTHMYMGSYPLASFHFKNFADNYPNSQWAEQALFLYAQSLSYDSAPTELDQESTKSAIDAYQLFINRYPQSPRVDSSNTSIDKLRVKLQQKAYAAASLYYKLEDYRAAAVAYRALLKDFPELPEREEVEFLVFKSYYLWAENSIPEKQTERYAIARESYANFVGTFPNSERMREALKLYRALEAATATKVPTASKTN
jgi:outer membrane protein assembly factor BamD